MIDSARDAIIDKVRYGQMTPEEAEAEAVRLNIEPFERRPKTEDFDPMTQTHWTLPMAVAWIAYRTPYEVREWWDAFRTECLVWFGRMWRIGSDGPIYEGYFLEQRAPASLARLRIGGIVDQVREGRDLKMSVAEAQNALWIAFREGLIEVVGINVATGIREKIPSHAWRDLVCHEERDRDVIQMPITAPGPGLRYEQVVVWRKAITGMWPDKLPPPPTLPETMHPTGPGFMPLFCAAQWIATRGGKQMFNANDQNVWKAAFDDLLAQISSDQVRAIGVRNGEREPVPGYHFAACAVDYPFLDAPMELLLSDELYLCSYPYLDEKHWNSGFDDSLRDRRGERWSRLMVRREDVARIWPFAEGRAGETGAPGRPSSMYLVEAQFKTRCEHGEVAASLASEAEILAKWLSSKHPDKPPLQSKTICNRLRSAFREYQNARK